MDEQDKRIQMLISLATVDESQETRQQAVLEIAKHYFEMRDKRRGPDGLNRERAALFRDMTDVLVKSVESGLFSEEVNTKIGLMLVEAGAVESDGWGILPLKDIIESNSFPAMVKKAAEVKYVDLIVRGWAEEAEKPSWQMLNSIGYAVAHSEIGKIYGPMITLVDIVNSESYSKEAKAAATEAIPVVAQSFAKLLAKRHINPKTFRSFGEVVEPTWKERDEDAFERKQALRNLIALLQDGRISDRCRVDAGSVALEVYQCHTDEEFLLQVSADAKIPNGLREKAGLDLVSYYTESCGDPDKVVALSKNNKVPETVRKAAEANLDEAVFKKWEHEIWQHVVDGRYKKIDEIIADDSVPRKAREFARGERERAIMNHIKCSTRGNLFAGYRGGEYGKLIAVSNDETVPDHLRDMAKANIEEAGEEAIFNAGRYSNSEEIQIRLAKDVQLPRTIRIKALANALEDYTREYCRPDLVSYRDSEPPYNYPPSYSPLLKLVTDAELMELDGKSIEVALEKLTGKTIQKFVKENNAPWLKRMSEDLNLPDKARAIAAASLQQLLVEIKNQIGFDGETIDAAKFSKRPVKAKSEQGTGTKGPKIKT